MGRPGEPPASPPAEGSPTDRHPRRITGGSARDRPRSRGRNAKPAERLKGKGGGNGQPGTFLLGSRYYQELADGIALDRAEHVAMGLEVNTPAGRFHGCVRVLETTPLEPGEESFKVYCPGIGLVMDNDLTLIEFQIGVRDHDDDDDDEEEDDD